MFDDKNAWLTTKDIQSALDGRRDNDIKVQVNGTLIPLTKISYLPVADCWVLEPYDGEDLRTALAVVSDPDPE